MRYKDLVICRLVREWVWREKKVVVKIEVYMEKRNVFEEKEVVVMN